MDRMHAEPDMGDFFQRMLSHVFKEVLPSPVGRDVVKIGSYTVQTIRVETMRVLRTVMAYAAFASGIASLEEAAKSIGVSVEHFKTMAEEASNGIRSRIAKMRAEAS
jgi:hypothetical protein